MIQRLKLQKSGSDDEFEYSSSQKLLTTDRSSNSKSQSTVYEEVQTQVSGLNEKVKGLEDITNDMHKAIQAQSEEINGLLSELNSFRQAENKRFELFLQELYLAQQIAEEKNESQNAIRKMELMHSNNCSEGNFADQHNFHHSTNESSKQTMLQIPQHTENFPYRNSETRSNDYLPPKHQGSLVELLSLFLTCLR